MQHLSLLTDDLVLKRVMWLEEPIGYLALPTHSSDPIVNLYLEGKSDNLYLLELLTRLAPRRSKILDLGAHVGTFSVPAALLGYSVLSIDADPVHTALIELSSIVNSVDIRVMNCAVADQDGPLRFIRDGLFGRIDYRSSGDLTHDVMGRRLDGLLTEMDFCDIAFIKMDVEGAELDALRAIEPLLRSSMAPPIIFESNVDTYRSAGYTISDLRQWLRSVQYDVFRVEADRWIRSPPDQRQPEAWIDMLALPRRREAEFAELIVETWGEAEFRDRCLEWAALPHPNTRLHMIQTLRDSPDERKRFPELEKAFNDLRRWAHIGKTS